MIDELTIGQLYSNDDIFRSLNLSNAGGIRVRIEADVVIRAAILTSTADFHAAGENPYHDRLEGEILTYTAAGKVGEQTLAGMNRRLIDQKEFNFPIHAFVQIASRRNKSVGPQRWKYLGLLEYLRHYPDTQLDSAGKVRKVWLFEFRIHREFSTVPLALDNVMSGQMLAASRQAATGNSPEDDLIADDYAPADNFEQIETIRSKLLALEARRFEFFIGDLLLHCGFRDVCVTKFSADGGVDVNARVGARIWLFESTLVQVQAKRWLHSVGRKEVAELRGSLQPFARGAVLTTSHFSRAAIHEAAEEGKNPSALVDGFRLSKIVLEEQFQLPDNRNV